MHCRILIMPVIHYCAVFISLIQVKLRMLLNYGDLCQHIVHQTCLVCHICVPLGTLACFLGNGKLILAIRFHERYLLWQKRTRKGIKI